MSINVWKGYGQTEVAADDAGIVVTIPDDARSFTCSIDNVGDSTVLAKLNTPIADFVLAEAIPVAAGKGYTWEGVGQGLKGQNITSVTLMCGSGESTEVNVAFS